MASYKYNKKVLEAGEDYLKNYNKKKYGDEIPSIVGLSLALGIARSTLYEWAGDEDKTDFANLMDRINAQQERVLLNKGLNGLFNPNITKLTLGKHGYHDKQDTKHSGGLGMIDLSGKTEDELRDIINGTSE